jgi:hypothetical protein
MKVVLIAPRAPQADGKGDAIRAATLRAALERNHEVDVFVPEAGTAHRVLAALWDLVLGRPAQVGFSMPRREWARAQQFAAPADIVIAITVRAVRGSLPTPLIIDHIDALSVNWALRASGPERWARRAVARLEANSLCRWEHRVARWAAGQLVLSEHEVAALPAHPPIRVVPQAVTFEAPPAAERDIDVVFTGNMRYPPNSHAALWLDREILPAVRSLHPGARVVVAGRGADRLALRTAETMSDVPSIPAVLARSRVAIVPLIGLGTGAPNKALEAAACGAALVVTPWMHERLPLPARVAPDAQGLACEVAALLADESARSAQAEEACSALGSYRVERIATELEAALYQATAT